MALDFLYYFFLFVGGAVSVMGTGVLFFAITMWCIQKVFEYVGAYNMLIDFAIHHKAFKGWLADRKLKEDGFSDD